MKIIITGGHITPALAVIDYIKNVHPEDKIVVVGREYSQDKLKQKAIEQKEVEKRDIEFISFNAPRFAKKNFINKFFNFFKLISSVIKANKIIKNQKPDVVLSFGGYLAVPIAIASKFNKTPVVTHEQTFKAGLANKMIAKFASCVALAYESSKEYFPEGKAVVTGNPFRKEIFDQSIEKPDWTGDIKKPILLIMGGNQGSRIINKIIIESLLELTEKYLVIHQCGGATAVENYLEILEQEKQKLPEELKSSYIYKDWIDDLDLFWIYKQASLVISRAGANSVLEIALAELPSILIPLPNSHQDEQALNAKWLLDAGGAVVIRQDKFNKSNLLKAVALVDQSRDQLSQNLSKLEIETNAEVKIYQVLQDLCGK